MKLMNKEVLHYLKNSFYIIWFVDGIILYFGHFTYKCNITGEKCFMCGTREAFSHILSFDFATAYQCNKLSILLFVLSIIFMIDIVRMIVNYLKERVT